MIKLTGLWERQDGKGRPMFSGSLGGARLVIFANNYKTESKHPDYIVYIDEQKKKEEPAAEQAIGGGDETPF